MLYGQLAAGADPRVIEHIPKFIGEIWFVSGSGDDNNPGNEPHRAKATIGAAITAASAGDMIKIRGGSYDENGLDVDKSLHIIGEYGAQIVDTTTGPQTLLVSGNSCFVENLLIVQAGQVAVKVTGSGNRFNEIVISACTVGFDIDGANTIVTRGTVAGHTTTAYDCSASRPLLEDCIASGVGGSTRGYYLSNAACDNGYFANCSSAGNTLSGFEIVTGASYNILNQVISGGGDGRRIDLGNENIFSSFICEADDEHTEHVYPWDALDPVITPGNQLWGATKVLVPIDGIVGNDVWNGATTIAWELIGLNISLTAITGKGKAFTWQVMRIVKATLQSLSGDANSGQKVVPMASTAQYLVDDIVWLADDDTVDGEIGKVASIQTDTSLTMEVNLANSYTTAQNAKCHLARREASGFESWEGKFLWNTEKAILKSMLHTQRAMGNGDGLIGRSYGIEDATPTAYFSVIYDPY